MLVIRADLVGEIVAHARRDHPLEACGQLTGPEESDRPEHAVPMTNALALESDYAFDSTEHIRVHRGAEDRGEESVVVYHSHTRIPRTPRTDTGLPEAYPSERDIERMAWNPGVHYVIVALATPDSDYDLRSYQLDDDGSVVEDDVQVVESYMFAHTGADDVPDNS